MDTPTTTNVARQKIFDILGPHGLNKPPKASEIPNFFSLREQNGNTKLWEERPDFNHQIELAIKELSGELIAWIPCI